VIPAAEAAAPAPTALTTTINYFEMEFLITIK
jgi:hypothetical protein